MDELNARLLRIAQHPVRGTFQLRGRDPVLGKPFGFMTVHGHTEELVRRERVRTAPRRDGHQPPYRGHPVFGADRSYVVETICPWTATWRGHVLPRHRVGRVL